MKIGCAPPTDAAGDQSFSARKKLGKAERAEVDKKLLAALASNHEEKIGELLDWGASVEARYEACTPIAGWTAGMLCAKKLGQNGAYNKEPKPNYERILRVCDPGARDSQGLTPLMHAASECCMEAVSILAPRSDLLAVCGDMGKDFDGGWTALFFALNVAHVEDGDPDKVNKLERYEAIFEKLACDGAWTVKSREGRDARAIVERVSPYESILALLRAMEARREALARANLLMAAPRGSRGAL